MNYSGLPITLRQLQYICAIADEGNFGRAAKRCGVSQPALSAQIAEVERSLELQLFERGRSGTRPTAAGVAIIERARAVLVATKELLDESKRHLDPLEGELKIGIIPTLAPYLLPDLDPAIREAFPELTLRWEENKTPRLVDQVESGSLDAIIVALESDLHRLVHEPLGRDEFLLAVPPDHPLAADEVPVSLEALRGEGVWLLQDGHCLGAQTHALCSLAGATGLEFRATSLPTLTQMVAAGRGITVLPKIAVEVENRRSRLAIRRFEPPEPSRTIVMAWRRDSALVTSLERLAVVARRAWQLQVSDRSVEGSAAASAETSPASAAPIPAE